MATPLDSRIGLDPWSAVDVLAVQDRSGTERTVDRARDSLAPIQLLRRSIRKFPWRCSSQLCLIRYWWNRSVARRPSLNRWKGHCPAVAGIRRKVSGSIENPNTSRSSIRCKGRRKLRKKGTSQFCGCLVTIHES